MTESSNNNRQQLIQSQHLVEFRRQVNIYDSYSQWVTAEEKTELDALADAAEAADKAFRDFQRSCIGKYGPVTEEVLTHKSPLPEGLQVITYWEDDYEFFLGTAEDHTTFGRLIDEAQAAAAELQKKAEEFARLHADVNPGPEEGLTWDDLDAVACSVPSETSAPSEGGLPF